jgi:hypothetical protein
VTTKEEKLAGEANRGVGRTWGEGGTEPFAAEAHPPQVDLERFMRGHLPRDRALKVVRHLLTGCPWCVHVTGRLWGCGEPLPGLVVLAAELDRIWQRHRNRLPFKGGMPFMRATADARAQLREIERQLEAIRFRLLGVQASLPPGPMEMLPLLEEETMDTPTHLRAVIKCVLEDSIVPAIRDLHDLADLPEERL